MDFLVVKHNSRKVILHREEKIFADVSIDLVFQFVVCHLTDQQL